MGLVLCCTRVGSFRFWVGLMVCGCLRYEFALCAGICTCLGVKGLLLIRFCVYAYWFGGVICLARWCMFYC